MKTISILFMTAVVTSMSANAQTGNASLEQTIYQFAKALNERDVHAMHYLLHEKFQALEKSAILSKSDYMKMLVSEKRVQVRAHVVSVDLGERCASAKVRISGPSAGEEVFLHLYKNDLGFWQIIHILPFIHHKV